MGVEAYDYFARETDRLATTSIFILLHQATERWTLAALLTGCIPTFSSGYTNGGGSGVEDPSRAKYAALAIYNNWLS